MNKSHVKLIGVLIVTLIMAVLLIAPAVSAGSFGPGSPDMPAVAQATTYTFFNARVLTTSTPLAYSTNPARMAYWASADVFVTADVSGTDTITVTPQYSPDNVNWVDATYSYLSNSSTTSVITGTEGLTATTSSATTLETVVQQIVLSSDTTSFMRIPIAGEYLRFKVENGGTVILTVKATMKNGTR